MPVQDLVLKVKRRDNPFYALLYRLARGALTFRVPVIRPLGMLLYYERSVRQTVFWVLKKIFYYEPLFRARCERVGENLTLVQGIPCIEGNLKIRIGDGVTVHGVTSFVAAPFNPEPVLEVGDGTFLGYAITIGVAERVSIGKGCLISTGCLIRDYDGHPVDPERRRRGERITLDEIRPVVLEDNVWLGNGVMVLKGVTIGRGSVIGAGSVVAKSIPPWSVAVGNPAQVIKTLTPDSQEEVRP